MNSIILLMLIPMVLIVVCYMAGDVVCTISRVHFNWGEKLVVGYVVCTALFQIMALPFMYYALEFLPLYYSYVALIVLLVLFYFILSYCRKSWKIGGKEFIYLSRDKKKVLIWGILGVGIFFQIAYVVLKQHTDIDDSFYIAEINTILETGKVLEIDPASGLAEFPFSASYKLVGYEVILALITKLFNVNAAFLCHTILPIFMILLHYVIIINIARRIAPQNATCFVLLYQIINLFSGYSGYSQGAFLLYRIWQGKAVMINIVVPILILTFLWIYENNTINWKTIGAITAVLISGFHTTTVALYLIPIAYFGLVVGFLVINRKGDNFIRLCLPVVFLLPLVALKFYILVSEKTLTDTGEEISAATSAASGAENLSYTYELMDKFLAGNKVWLLFILVALILILLKGNRKEKGVIAIPTVVLVLTFCNPLLINFVAGYVTGSSVYWRVFWLLEFPFILVTAIGIVVRNILDREVYGILAVSGAMVIAVNGAYIFDKSGFADRSNKYKLDSVSVTIADIVLEDANSYTDDNEELVLMLPVEISYGIREYTGKISLIVNRYSEGTFAKNGKKKEWEKLNEELIQPLYGEKVLSKNGEIYKKLRYFNIDYVVVYEESVKSEDAIDGLEHVGNCANYSIYRIDE